MALKYLMPKKLSPASDITGAGNRIKSNQRLHDLRYLNQVMLFFKVLFCENLDVSISDIF